jgi:membrane protease subunit HflK
MFNLNDSHKGHRGAFAQNGSPPESGEPPPPPPPPPRPPGRGRGPNQGPPDLDELWRDFNRRLSGMFGDGGRRGPRRGGDFQPDMKSAGLALAAFGVVALLVWLASGAFIVDVGQQAVITRFGSYQATVGEGFNWRLPYLIERHEIVDFSQIRSVDVGSDSLSRGTGTGLRDSAMLTKDENIVEIKFSVQYRLHDTRAFLFNSKSPEIAVVQAAESAVREVVGQMTMDSAMADEREHIAPHVRELTQKILDRYQVGIEIMAVNIGQEGVRPPEQVKDAFDDVIKAGQEREGAKNKAQAYANKVVPLATGTAARLAQEAEGYKASVVAQAQGDAERFSAVLAEYQKAPKVTRDRLYLDAMRQVYRDTSKIIVDGKSGASLLYLPLDKMVQAAGAPQPAATEAAALAVAAPAATPAAGTSDARGRDNERSREREPR